MKVLFVGPVSGYTSYPVVSKGLLRAFIAAGIEPVVADVTADGSPDHTEPKFDSVKDSIRFLDQGEVVDLVHKAKLPSDDIDVCVAVNPSYHLLGIRESGVRMAGMFIGDVDSVPDSWKQLMNKQDLVLTPSSWYKQVIAEAGIKKPVMALNHGVSSVFKPRPDCEPKRREDGEPYVFFHPCSAVFFPERKGTPQVLQAFSQLVEEGHNVVLRLVFGMKSKPIKQLIKACSPEVRRRLQIFFFSGARAQEEIIKTYQSCDAGLFPSRAEGFGIIPLEMRACSGVPIVQTFCTGHRDHLDPDDNPARWGIVQVQHGPMTKAWGKMGRAPEVTVKSVYSAMKQCLMNSDALSVASCEMAEAVGTQWSWHETTKPLIRWLRETYACG